MTALSKDFSSDRGTYNSTTNSDSPAWHKFGSATDDKATIAASGYFDFVIDGDDSGNEIAEPSLKIGDFIGVLATDGNAILVVSAVSPAVTVTTLV